MKLLWIMAMIFTLSFIGCSGKSNIGDGKIDSVEEAEIRIAVGLVLSAKPTLVPVAALVSSKLLDVMSDDYISVLGTMDIIIARELKTLGLTPEELVSANDLIMLVKAKIIDQVGENTVDGARLIMVKQVVRIINESANARIPK